MLAAPFNICRLNTEARFQLYLMQTIKHYFKLSHVEAHGSHVSVRVPKNGSNPRHNPSGLDICKQKFCNAMTICVLQNLLIHTRVHTGNTMGLTLQLGCAVLQCVNILGLTRVTR